MPRIFVSLPVPADVAAALGRILPDLTGLRRVDPALMHVTLAFVGEVDEQRVPAVLDAVRAAAGANGPFDVDIASVGAFPPHGRPRTVWAGTSAAAQDATVRLGASVRAALLRGGIRFDPKPLRAHVTLGRVRDGAGDDEARAIATAVASARAGTALAFRASSIHVMESRLSPKGPLYSSRGEFRLAGPPGPMSVSGSR